jgi:sortase A
MRRHIRGLTILERCLLVAGLICLAIFGGVLLYRSVSSRQALRAFDQARTAKAPEHRQEAVKLNINEKVDFRRWSEQRVRAYRESLLSHQGSPMAALSIDKLKMRVPVFEGTDELALNRGVGWIAGTARPGESGNVGIAGHRDGFFRGLKDISLGDTIKLTTLEGTLVYKVDQFEIVTPDDVSVLRPRGGSSLTLVTCYPFYFVGSAPQRFILHAALNRAAGSSD